VNDTRPLRDQVEQQRALLLVHRRRLEPLWLDDLPILPRAEHEVTQGEGEDGLGALIGVERAQ
jgi:hypothetical protein